ncbi:hypothetical protein V1512DRAFT_222996 [Lipomyces arxii]|uniref:uncharacterized protein n=1 Tax=Lipomyces arxii TaxID=56418 RepID=UPI0034CF5B6E
MAENEPELVAPSPDSQADIVAGGAAIHERTIRLRISSPAALPASVTSTLEFELMATETVLSMKKQVAEKLHDALLFATGEPWTSTVYTLDVQNANEELVRDVKGDSIMRIIFQGRFLKDELTLAEIVRDNDQVTFHMMLKPSIVDVLTTAYRQQTTTSSQTPGVSHHTPADLFGSSPATPQSIPAMSLPPAPVGTNIVLYQDPQARTPLLSPYSTYPVVTNNGHLALLVSPQGISDFANAGISILPGNSSLIPGVPHGDGDSSYLAGFPADLAMMLQTNNPHQGPPPHDFNNIINNNINNNNLSLLSRLRTTLSDLRNNAQRLRNTLALTWLFLRLVFFVSILAGELGGSRFWTVTFFAIAIFLWRANLMTGIGAGLGRRVFNNVNMPQNNNNNNINRGVVGTIFLRDEHLDVIENEPRLRRLLRELERVVVVFVGTLVPAVYDTWHRHELAMEEARARRQREREAEAEAIAAATAAAATAATDATEQDPQPTENQPQTEEQAPADVQAQPVENQVVEQAPVFEQEAEPEADEQVVDADVMMEDHRIRHRHVRTHSSS